MKTKLLSTVVVIIFVVGAVGYFVFVKKSQPAIQTPPPASSQPSANQLAPISQSETAHWITYRNEKYGFEMKYPNYLTAEPSISVEVKEYREKVDKNFEEAFGVELNETLRVISKPKQSGLTIDIISGKAMNDFISFESKREILETWYYDATPPKLLRDFVIFGKKGVLRRGPLELSTYNSSEIMIENKENQLIRISFYAQVSHEDIERLLDQILSTLRFTQ